ncbi:hypothetical protein IMW75_03295 [Pseudomonas gregormendelii]|uniref:Uncharacterized protein n=1 Tax=Pseudomonas gregormendelii TaxID=1628277 RepID=A0ABS3AAV0_9PSED|nr:hypothetical protein [Pseudomonas gregormendelii]MBN3964310.1 hypothetical protein [Pseudomonas gregormendelii]
MKRKLTLHKTSETTLLTESELNQMLDEFLAGQLTVQAQSNEQGGDRVSLRLALEQHERGTTNDQ